MAYTFQGIDPTQRRTGQQAKQYLEQTFGQPLSQQQQQQAGQFLGGQGYTDATGNSEMSGAQYNALLQEAARLIPGSTFQAFAPQASTQQQPITFESTPAPTYTAPELEQTAPYQAPAPFQYDAYDAPDPFQHEAWQQTTAQDLYTDPGYEHRMLEGQKALERTRAASGLFRTGATMQALTDYGQRRGSEEFSNVDARRRADYQTGYSTASDTYDRNAATGRYGYETNRQNAADAYDRNAATGRYGYEQGVDAAQRRYEAETQNAQAEYAPSLLSWQSGREDRNRAAELNFDRTWQSEIYNRDDAFRRQEADRNERFRNTQFSSDDEYRRWLALMNKDLSLAELGTRS